MKDIQQIVKILKLKKELFALESQPDENYYSFAKKAQKFLTEINEYRNMNPETDELIKNYEQMVWDTLMLYAADLETKSFKK